MGGALPDHHTRQSSKVCSQFDAKMRHQKQCGSHSMQPPWRIKPVSAEPETVRKPGKPEECVCPQRTWLRQAALIRRTTPPRGRLLHAALTIAIVAIWPALTLPAIAAPAINGSAANEDTRPYDAKLLRLSELLGSIHYLRELCGANEGQFWRDTMQELIKSEGSSAIRRARFTESFNQGYRSYSRTYNVCTPTARAAIDRFLNEGAEIASSLIKDAR
jgi:uncharacterized protein (TIGR02301 family)